MHLCIQILNKLPSLSGTSLSRCDGCVCEAFLLPLPLFSLPWVPALSFVTIKKLECL